MPKSSSQVGATISSGSPETKTTKRKSKFHPQECTPEEESTTCQDTTPVTEGVNEEGDTPEEFQERLDACHKLIKKFAKKMAHGYDCQALIAKELWRDLLVEDEVYENDIKLPAEQIIADAHAIMHAGRLLHENFTKEHDNAVKVLGEIMSRHAPHLQKVWSEWAEKEHNK